MKGQPNVWSSRGPASIAMVSIGVGMMGGAGLMLGLMGDTYSSFGYFLLAKAVFHVWEFIYVALFHAEDLNNDSFLLNHSNEFHIAFGAAVVEFMLEAAIFPSLKTFGLFRFVGFILVIAGQAIRTIAMHTAGSNFHHQVQSNHKNQQHELVTVGIYQYLRHPSYFGWYYWAVGTQILLGNPICIGAYAYVAWKFFSERIEHEEEELVKSYGEKYETYRKATPTGIPYIK